MNEKTDTPPPQQVESSKVDPAQLERENQLQRRIKKKKKRKDGKDPFETKYENGPSLEDLVSKSPYAESIYETLSKVNATNSNPILGMKILLKLPDSVQKETTHLVLFPRWIVEYLLMHQKLVELTSIFKDFDELRDNNLLMTYAQKALSFPDFTMMSIGPARFEWREQINITEPPPRNSEFTVTLNDTKYIIIWNYLGHWVGTLNGLEEQQDNETRRDHFFSGGTPDINLAISIISLSKSKKLGQNLIDLCDSLSESLSQLQSSNQLLTTSLIADLLGYAKSIFHQENNEGKIALCDSYLRDIELLRTLAHSKCSFQVSLIDLADVQKLRFLRDNLVHAGFLELAFSVTASYNLDPEPVWGAWGFQLLKAGNFDAAKEKLKYYFTSRVTRVSTATMLQDIITTLEMLPDNSNEHHHFTDDTYDVRFKLCVYPSTSETDVYWYGYFLSTYGTSAQLLKFLVRHKKLAQAVQHFISQSLPSSAFVEHIVMHCTKNSLVTELFAAIKEVDPNMAAMREHLLACCNYFLKTNDLLSLLAFQEQMEDHARSALTCIKLCVESPCEQATKDKYLELSREHFLEEIKCINRGGGTGSRLLPVSEIHKYLKKLKLQCEISSYLRSQQDEVPEAVKNASLFGTTKQRTDLAEWVLFFGNFDLGIGLILNFHLPTTSVLSATVLNLVKANHWKRVEELVQRVKKILVDTEDWDNFATSCIKTFMEMGNSTLAGKMVDYVNKIDAMIFCGKLKSAYLLAVKIGRRDKVIRIRDEALAKNNVTELRMCEKYLSLSTSSPDLLKSRDEGQ